MTAEKALVVLVEVFRGKGELTLNEDARNGVYDLLVEAMDDLAVRLKRK